MTTPTLDQLDDITSAIEATYPYAYPLDMDGDNMARIMRDQIEAGEEPTYTLAHLLRAYAAAIEKF
jgi:hypothetical protein